MMKKRQYPQIRCNDIVNNSRHRFANCHTDHWVNSVLMVQNDRKTCWGCDLREPVPTKQERAWRCLRIIDEMFKPAKVKRRRPEAKQLNLFNQAPQTEASVSDELPF
jgi:hypothetical protein